MPRLISLSTPRAVANIRNTAGNGVVQIDQDGTINVTPASGKPVKLNGKQVASVASQALSAAGDTIQPVARHIRLTGTGLLTLTSTPTISTTGAVDGQLVRLTNVGASAIILQPVALLSGSKLRLTSALGVTLGSLHSIELEYNASIDRWVQVSGIIAVV